MPRTYRIFFGDIEGKLDVLNVECTQGDDNYDVIEMLADSSSGASLRLTKSPGGSIRSSLPPSGLRACRRAGRQIEPEPSVEQDSAGKWAGGWARKAMLAPKPEVLRG